MSLTQMYDEIAKQYAMADRFGSISQSHASALKQLEHSTFAKPTQHPACLDLGVGDGAFLKKIVALQPNATYTGMDISQAMLAIAQKKIPTLQAIHDSAVNATTHLSPHTQDLVLAHFINAYIPIDTLLEQVSILLKSKGYFSMITTTHESFPLTQRFLTQFIGTFSFWGLVVRHYYHTGMKQACVVADQQTLFDTLHAHHFSMVSHQQLHIPLQFENVQQLLQFGIEGSWFLNKVSASLASKKRLTHQIESVFEKIFTFPYEDTHIIEVVLASRL